MPYLVKTFLRGLLFVVPVVATVWLFASLFLWIDGLVKLPGGRESLEIPFLGVELRHGLGLIVTVTIIFAVGLLTSNVLTRWILRRIDRLFQRVPLVKQVYTSIKDMIEAFISEEKKFDKPVLLQLGGDGDVEVIGFVTHDDLEDFGRPGKVAVYVPQSYNFAANLILVPRARVTALDLAASEVMTFVVSGGVSGLHPPTDDEDED